MRFAGIKEPFQFDSRPRPNCACYAQRLLQRAPHLSSLLLAGLSSLGGALLSGLGGAGSGVVSAPARIARPTRSLQRLAAAVQMNYYPHV